jgi:hypothetical protein
MRASAGHPTANIVRIYRVTNNDPEQTVAMGARPDKILCPLPAAPGADGGGAGRSGAGARSWHASQEMAATAMILTKLLLPPISARPPCCIVRSGERILRCNNLSSLPGCCWQYQPEPGSRVMLPYKALRSGLTGTLYNESVQHQSRCSVGPRDMSDISAVHWKEPHPPESLANIYP